MLLEGIVGTPSFRGCGCTVLIRITNTVAYNKREENEFIQVTISKTAVNDENNTF